MGRLRITLDITSPELNLILTERGSHPGFDLSGPIEVASLT